MKSTQRKLPTYKAKQAILLNNLEARGWTVQRGLKVPHATAPDFMGMRRVRVWFKAQSIHIACSSSGNPSFRDSRSIHAGDFRSDGFTCAQLLRLVGYYSDRA